VEDDDDEELDDDEDEPGGRFILDEPDDGGAVDTNRKLDARNRERAMREDDDQRMQEYVERLEQQPRYEARGGGWGQRARATHPHIQAAPLAAACRGCRGRLLRVQDRGGEGRRRTPVLASAL